MNTFKVKTIFNVKPVLVVLLAALLLISSCGSVWAAVLPTTQDFGVDAGDQPLPGYISAGPAPQGMRVLVDIAIPLRNVDHLSSMVKAVSDPASPLFGGFLTSAQIKEEFLPTAQYESMLAYVGNAKLPVVAKALDSIIVVSATVAQVNQVFHSDVSIYTNGANSYYMTTGNAMLNGAHFLASNATALMVKPQLASTSPAEQATGANVTYTKSGISARDLPEVYNATPLYKQGFNGENQTIGILDFFGSPTVEQDLQQFSTQYGYPSATLNVIPIGPYNPNLGAYTGWSTEVSLDVQMAHAMAPQAELDLYVASGALSVAADLAQIVSLNRITTLSMSLSFAYEWQYSLYGGEWFFFNMFLPDQYFMVGSLMGITFLCSSGDAGGSGYSSGPAGNSAYPSDSPYVTSVGGTQTYIYTQPNGSKTSVQTGWSNRAYVPDIANAGGGGGGVSFMEPKPWYQQNQQTPPSYPNGRMEPDLSLQAGIFPGIYIIDEGQPRITGGTSASAPLLAGFVALMAQSTGRSLGLINPLLYSLGNNQTLYTKAYTPITFGYTIPWTASYGYNLVTGWGAPNIGQIAAFCKTQPVQPSLSVDVSLMDSTGAFPFEVTPNQIILVIAEITNNGVPASTGSFTAKLVTLAGTSLDTVMAFDSANHVWVCALTMGQQSGVAYIDVSGASQGVSGQGTVDIFAGYIATFHKPAPTDPWTTAGEGLQVIATSTDLEGNPAPTSLPLTMQINSYSILTNTFRTVDTVQLSPTNDSQLGIVPAVNLTEPYPAGPLTFMTLGNTYGILPITNGIYLQTTVMYPEVAAEPGCLAPGQSLTIVASPIAPINIADLYSYDTGATVGSDIARGSSITAVLVNPSGTTIAESDLAYQNSKIRGTLQVPATASSGLYTVLLLASYECSTLQITLYGSFFGQVWVSNGTITPQITLLPSTLYMGQTAEISVDLRYPNDQEVTQGQYTAVIYPQQMQDQYAQITNTQYANSQLTTLSFNPALNRWVANITLPSPSDAGAMSAVTSAPYYAGPYEAYVTGISYDGVPTTAAMSAQKAFYIQPYLYVANREFASLQQSWGLALTGVTIMGTADLSNNVFLESNYVQSSTAVISDSIISGTLFVTGANLTLRGVHGGNIIATNSTVNLINSDINALATVNSVVSLTASSYGTLSPSAPVVQILSPLNGASYQGNLNLDIMVSGSNVNSVVASLNGQVIKTFGNNGTQSFTLQSANYTDGTYVMQVTATQTNGISTSANATMYFVNQANAVLSSLNALNSTQAALQNQANGLQTGINSLNSGQSSLQNQLGNLGNQMNGLGENLNSLNSSQSALQNQIGNLGSNLTSGINGVNSAQSTIQNQLQNQVDNLGSNLNNLNSTQQNQINSLGSNVTSSFDALNTQIAGLKDSLNNTQTLAIAGIAIGIIGISIAVVVLSRRQKISTPPNLSK